MNEGNLNYNNNANSNVYKATSNLNTAMENLNSGNINNATSVNVLGPDYSPSESYNQDFALNNGIQSSDMYMSSNSIGIPDNNINMQSDYTSTLDEQQNIQINNVQSVGSFENNTVEYGVNIPDLGNQNNQVVSDNLISTNDNGQFIAKPLNYDEINSSGTFLGGSTINPELITNSNSDVYMGGDAITTTDKKVSYEPIVEQKKNPNNSNNSDSGSFKEGIVVIVICLLLLAFIWVMPLIYDFFSDLWLNIVNG